MGPLVDEAGLGVIVVLARPGGQQIVVERRAAAGAAVRRLPVEGVEDRAHRLQRLVADRLSDFVVAVLGAAAQRLLARRGGIALAHGGGQQGLHQAGAGAAGGRGLGVRPHLVQGEQSLAADGPDDVTLADAVAAADLGVVGKLGHPRLVAVAGVSQVVLAKQDGVAEAGDVGALAQQLEVPAAVEGVAVHHRALDAVVADHQLLVDPLGRVLQHQGLVTLPFVELAGGKEIDAGDLQLGGGDRAFVTPEAEMGQMIGADLGLLE